MYVCDVCVCVCDVYVCGISGMYMLVYMYNIMSEIEKVSSYVNLLV